jgi:hypothetical protein
LAENEILDFAKTQLTLPDKIDLSDAMSWQHHLYSKLGTKKTPSDQNDLSNKGSPVKDKQQQLDELVDRIVAMAKVLFGLHMVYIYFLLKKSFCQHTARKPHIFQFCLFPQVLFHFYFIWNARLTIPSSQQKTFTIRLSLLAERKLSLPVSVKPLYISFPGTHLCYVYYFLFIVVSNPFVTFP